VPVLGTKGLPSTSSSSSSTGALGASSNRDRLRGGSLLELMAGGACAGIPIPGGAPGGKGGVGAAPNFETRTVGVGCRPARDWGWRGRLEAPGVGGAVDHLDEEGEEEVEAGGGTGVAGELVDV
jgi:hypothetical protein